MSGIYEIKNIKDGKRYIGSTKKKFDHRWSSHKKSLRENNHTNNHLQSAWNKYGEDSFQFNILEAIDESEFDNYDQFVGFIEDREDCYIEKYGVLNDDNGYNFKNASQTKITEELREMFIGENNPMYGRSLDEETKEKLKLAWDNKSEEEEKQRIKDVISRKAKKWWNNMSEEEKEEFIGSRKGWCGEMSDEEREKFIDKNFSGENNPRYNKSHSQESIEKIKSSLEGKLDIICTYLVVLLFCFIISRGQP